MNASTRSTPTRSASRSAELEPAFAAVARHFGLLSEPTRIEILLGFAAQRERTQR